MPLPTNTQEGRLEFLREQLEELREHQGFRFPTNPVGWECSNRRTAGLSSQDQPSQLFKVAGRSERRTKEMLSLADSLVDQLSEPKPLVGVNKW